VVAAVNAEAVEIVKAVTGAVLTTRLNTFVTV